LFVVEDEGDPERVSIHRQGHYCLDLGELFETDQVVPVVIFLRGTVFAVYAAAVQGLVELEQDPEKKLKYLDFIDIYADLDDNE